MKLLLFFMFAILGFASAFGQVDNPKFKNKIDRLLKFNVPIITVEDLKAMDDDIVLLDAREWEEYQVSRIPEAQFIGYKKPQFQILDDVAKDCTIVIYCSIGYRSEKLGKKIQEKGFKDVRNLYGSIFEWANQGQSLEDAEGKSTQKVHTYNRRWSKWVDNPRIEKVY